MHPSCDGEKTRMSGKVPTRHKLLSRPDIPVVLPEGLRKTSQTHCPLRTYRQPIISQMAKAGEDPQFFPLYILHCFGRQNTTETIPLVDKGHTDFILAETHKTQHSPAFTLKSYLCQQEHMQFLPPMKKQFLQNVKTTHYWSKLLKSTFSDFLEEKHWGRYFNLFRK